MNSPPQFGQMPRNLFSTQSAQKVHSKVQILASVLPGARSLLQHSQLGLSCNIDLAAESHFDSKRLWLECR